MSKDNTNINVNRKVVNFKDYLQNKDAEKDKLTKAHLQSKPNSEDQQHLGNTRTEYNPVTHKLTDYSVDEIEDTLDAMKESIESNVEFTVGKLIEELKKYDSNLPVRVGCHGYSNQEIVQIVEKPEYDNENEITILQINGNGSWENQDEDDSYDDNGDNGVIHDEEFYPRRGRGK